MAQSTGKPDARATALELLGIMQRALDMTAEPWLHEADLDSVLDDLDALPIQALPEDVNRQAMSYLIRSVHLLIGAAQVELSAAGDARSRLWTESKRTEVLTESKPVRYFATWGVEDGQA